MERLAAKPRQAALERKAELAKAWADAMPSHQETPDGRPVPSPASVLSALLARTLDGTGLSLNFPATWPSYLSVHVLVKSPTGRRHLVHVDPSHGDAELFAAARGLAYGVRLPAPPPPDPALRQGNVGDTPDRAAPAPACGFFLDPDEARFHRRLAVFAPAFSAPAPSAPDAAAGPASKALGAFLQKRVQALLDVWGAPDRFRKETRPFRDYLADAWVPPRTGGVAEAARAWEAARAREEALRKGAKAQRDGFAGRYSALGQNIAGLPQDQREVLETLDKAAPWQAKVQAALVLELSLNKLAGKAGAAGAKMAAAAAGVAASAVKGPADKAAEAHKERMMKGLSGRFKKL